MESFCTEKIAKIVCVDFFFLFGFFDMEDTLGQNFDQHSMICTHQAHSKKKVTPFFHQKQAKTGLKKHFKGKLWANRGVEISATPTKNKVQHSSKKVQKIFGKHP